MLNLSILLEDCAKRYPSRSAFTYSEKTFTFEQINNEANLIANALVSIGIKPGDKVALTCPNIPYFPIIYHGILKAGAIVVPLNILLKKDEVVYHLYDSDAKAYFCFEGTDELPMGTNGRKAFKEVATCLHYYLIRSGLSLKNPVEGSETLNDLVAGQSATFESVQTSADDTAIIIYTSGTTGAAKGAELTHSNLYTNAVVSSDILKSAKEDTQLIVLPLFHIFGMTVLMNAGLYKGIHSILLPRFDAGSVFGLIKKHSISILAAVPTMYWSLLNYSDKDLHDTVIADNLRICVSGGASLPVNVLTGFEERFHVTILEGYGMSEGSPVVTFNQLEVGRKPGSIGTPVWGVEVKVVGTNGEELAVGEKGELIYRGPNVMKQYYKKPELTAESVKNGWLHSGDIAVKDEDGFFFIVDRMKDMIIRGGFNVYPREVEEMMIKHVLISMVAVVGVPSLKLGEDIKAFVVLKKGASLTSEEIILWAKERIASYKYPRIVEIVESFPISASGKILKKELRNLL